MYLCRGYPTPNDSGHLTLNQYVINRSQICKKNMRAKNNLQRLSSHPIPKWESCPIWKTFRTYWGGILSFTLQKSLLRRKHNIVPTWYTEPAGAEERKCESWDSGKLICCAWISCNSFGQVQSGCKLRSYVEIRKVNSKLPGYISESSALHFNL